MSARAARRLLNEREKQKVSTNKDEEGESEEEEAASGSSLKPNLFALLGEGEEVEEEEENSDSDENALSQKKKPKKKKKKKKGSKSQKTTTEVDELEIAIAEAAIDAKILEENMKRTQIVKSELLVDPKALSVQHEMRHLFGNKTVANEQRAAYASRYGVKGHQRQPRLRKTLLAPPRDHWPRLAGGSGLSMELVDSNGGVYTFRYCRSPEYRRVHLQFLACVETNDPHTLADLLVSEPWHVETLLQLAEFCKQTGEHASCDDLVERALYALECAWHPSFQPSEVSVRLDYNVEENKSFYLALFRQLQSAGRRACHRSAFEICKLLLMLSPEKDPLGIMLCIDYYSLRAGQYQFLLRFLQSSEAGRDPIQTLPNLAINGALAQYRCEEERREKNNLGHEEEDKEPESIIRLASALLNFSHILVSLAEKIGVSKQAQWITILAHPAFSSRARTETLEHIEAIFVERNYLLWKAPDAALFLLQAAKRAVARYDAGDRCVVPQGAGVVGADRLALYRHVQISDFSDNVVTLPDDAPPDPFARQHQRGGGGAAAAAVGEPLNAEANPLLLFLQSLLPWTAPPAAHQQDDWDDYLD